MTQRIPSASDVAPLAIVQTPAILCQITLINHQLSTGKMAAWSIRPEWPFASSTMSKVLAMTLPQATQHILAPSVVTQPKEPGPAPITELSSVLYIHMTLYIVEVWHHTLLNSDINTHFPFLINEITFGSPIGNPLPLPHTLIPVNLPSALKLPHIIDNETAFELAAMRMSSQCSVSKAHTIFNGHFHTSPLGLIEKIPRSGKWCMICNLLKQDEHSDSTNGWLNIEDYPTKFYSVNMMADYMSLP